MNAILDWKFRVIFAVVGIAGVERVRVILSQMLLSMGEGVEILLKTSHGTAGERGRGREKC
jgi:hypothetical protein